MKVKSIFFVLFLLVTSNSLAFADIIHLKNGRQIKAEDTWEEGNLIKFYRYGQVVGYPKDKVSKIEKEKTDKIPNVSSTKPKENVTTHNSSSVPTDKTDDGISAFANGIELLRVCNSAEKSFDDPSHFFSSDIIKCSKFGLDIYFAMKDMNQDTSRNKIACFPETGISIEQVVRILTYYLKNNPASLNLDATTLTVLAFKKAYPCR